MYYWIMIAPLFAVSCGVFYLAIETGYLVGSKIIMKKCKRNVTPLINRILPQHEPKRLIKQVLEHTPTKQILDSWGCLSNHHKTEKLVSWCFFGCSPEHARERFVDFDECLQMILPEIPDNSELDSGHLVDYYFTESVNQVTHRPLAVWAAQKSMISRANYIMRKKGFERVDAGAFNAWVLKKPGNKRIMLLHGIGVGLYPYLNLIMDLVDNFDATVICPEFIHITMTDVERFPSKEEIVNSFKCLYDAPSVIIAHSFGTVFASYIVQDAPELVDSVIMVAPVCFRTYNGDVIRNFLAKNNRGSITHRVLCRDANIQMVIKTQLDWSKIELWPHKIKDHKVTVVLSANDHIVPSSELEQYLIANEIQVVIFDGKHGCAVMKKRDILLDHVQDHVNEFDFSID